MVYFIRSKRSGRIKIGYSKNVLQRAMSVRSMACSNVTILGTMEGDRITEKSLHLWFDWLNITGEWFEPHAELLAYIEKAATPWTGPMSVGWERPEEYWQRVENPSPKIGSDDKAAGPRIKRNLRRLMNEGAIPKTFKAVAALVQEQTGHPFGCQRLTLMLNSAYVEARYVELLAAGIGRTCGDLLR